MRTLLLVFAAVLSTGHAAAADCPASLNFKLRPLTGSEPVRLCDQYAGRVVLVVNTASRCAYTDQYAGLEKLHHQFKEQGFTVMGFPSNDFGGQEPGAETEIKNFCRTVYGVQFPMFEKIRVARRYAHPFYAHLAQQTNAHPRWNFHKYLIGRDGEVLTSFASHVTPEDPRLRKAIEDAL